MDIFILLSTTIFVCITMIYLIWSHTGKKKTGKRIKKNKKGANKASIALTKDHPPNSKHSHEYKEMVENARQMAKNEPDRVAKMIQEWIKEDPR